MTGDEIKVLFDAKVKEILLGLDYEGYDFENFYAYEDTLEDLLFEVDDEGIEYVDEVAEKLARKIYNEIDIPNRCNCGSGCSYCLGTDW